MRLRMFFALAAVGAGALLIILLQSDGEPCPLLLVEPEVERARPHLATTSQRPLRPTTPVADETPGVIKPAPEATAPKPRIRLTGRVVDAVTGAAIPDVVLEQVGAASTSHDYTFCYRIGDVSSTRSTSADGTFELDVDLDDRGLLRLSAEGYATALFRIRYPARLTREGWTLALVPAAGIQGVVHDEQGRPVAGVKVYARPVQAASTAEDPSFAYLMVLRPGSYHGAYATRACPSAYRCRVVKTDPDGRYAFTGLPAGSYQTFWAAWDGRTTPLARSVRVAPDSSRRVPLRFVRLSTLTLRARYADGVPMQSQSVQLLRRRDYRFVARVRLDEKGTAVFPHLHPGTYQLMGAGYRHVDVLLGEDITVVHTSDRQAPVSDADAAWRTVTHKLVDGNGRAIPDAEVDVTHGRKTTTVRTDADGRFRFECAPQRSPELMIRAAGFHPEAFHTWEVRGLDAPVVLRRLIPITIRATFPVEDPPLKEAEVILRTSRGTGYSPDLLWEHTASGQATLRIEAWPAVERLEFLPARHVRFDLELDLQEETGPLTKDVVLDPGVILPLHVRGPTGALARVLITVRQDLPAGPTMLRFGTDVHGRARISGIAPDVPFDLRVEARGHTPFDTVWTRAHTVSETEIRLKAVGVLAGRVLDAQGFPLAGARVQPSRTTGTQPRQRSQFAETDEAGRFRLPLAAGEYRIDVLAPPGTGLRGKQVEVQLAARETTALDVHLESD